MTAVFNNLKLVNFDNKLTPKDPKTLRRTKLAAKITEQMAAARAATEGLEYTRSNGKRRRLRKWFQQVDGKRWAVQLFYGSKVLEFAKGKNAVECSDIAAVVATLEVLNAAVLAGDLDAQIAGAADLLKKGFRKK